MKNYAIGILSFIGGAALSGIIVWKVVEKKSEEKYKAIADEEIASVKEHFTVPRKEIKLELPDKDKKEELKATVNTKSLTEIAKEIAKPYTNYSNTKEPEKRTLPWEEGPYVIEPDKYGEHEAYDQVELTLYADGILADEKDDIVRKGIIGDALDHMGEYDDDVVHVCDPVRKVYYEITADNRSYEDATGRTPPDEED